MVLLNTTFYVHVSVKDDFIRWMREKYVPAAMASGVFADPVFSLVEHKVEPDALTYAVQLKARDVAAARDWHDSGAGCGMRNAIMKQYGQKVLFFTSFMDILPL